MRSGRARSMGAPWRRIWPRRAGTRPDTVRSRVVLPAPFAPIRATICPSPTRRDTWWSTSTGPYPALTPSNASTSAPAAARRRGGASAVRPPRYASTTAGSVRTSSGVPSAIFLPKLSTAMRSHTPMTTFISCSIRRMVRPASRRSAPMRAVSACVSAGFIPAAGSSRSRSRGSVASALAISSRRWSPYGSAPAGSCARGPSPTRSSSSRARVRTRASSVRWAGAASPPSSRVARVRRCRPMTTFSRADIPRNRRMFWKGRAMPRAVMRSGRSPPVGSPRNRTRPAVARRKPVMTLNSVVFPAPLGPISPTISPSATANDTSSTARSPPNATETRSHSSMPPPPEPRAQDAVGQIDRHQHQGGAVHEQPVLAEEAERFREDRQDDAAEDRPEEGGGPAEDRVREDVDRFGETRLRRVDDVGEVHREPARQPREEPGDREGQHLVVGDADPHRLGRRFVFPDRGERPSHPRALEAVEEARRQEQDAVHVPERHEMRNPHEAQRPAGDREVEGDDADDFAERQRGDGQVDPAQPEGRDANDRRDGGRERGAAEQGGPERGVDVAREDRGRVPADGGERGVAERALAGHQRHIDRQGEQRRDDGEQDQRAVGIVQGRERRHRPVPAPAGPLRPAAAITPPGCAADRAGPSAG